MSESTSDRRENDPVNRKDNRSQPDQPSRNYRASAEQPAARGKMAQPEKGEPSVMELATERTRASGSGTDVGRVG